jgi:hypothetical protein
MLKVTFRGRAEAFRRDPRLSLAAAVGFFEDSQPNWPGEVRFLARILFPVDGSAPRRMEQPAPVSFALEAIREINEYDPGVEA